MAYLKDIDLKCQGGFGCKSKASVELYNRFNGLFGRFCRRCGNVRLKAMQAQEEKDPIVRPNQPARAFTFPEF
jgi:hypothetical protein